MSNKSLILDRVSFERVHIDPTDGHFKISEVFPQIELEKNDFSIAMKGDLFYPDEQLNDPRNFTLVYGVKIDDVGDNARYPYKIDVVAVGYLRYNGDDEFSGIDRFTAVRFSGYQILHGAVREIVCNLTARNRHGMFSIPSCNFFGLAREHAQLDEVARQKKIELINK